MSSERSRTLTLRVAAALLVAVLFVLFADSFLSPPDCLAYWSWGESLATDFDFDFRDEFVAGTMHAHIPYMTVTGRLSNDWPMGSGLALIPALLFGKAAAHAWVLAIFASSCAFWWRGAGGCRSGRALAMAGMVAGTPLLFYAAFGPFFSHLVSFAATTAFLVAWDRTRARRAVAEWILLGLLLGAAALARPQNLLLAVVFLAEVWALDAERLRGWGIAALAAVLAFAPQMAVYRLLYGSFFALPKLEEMHWFAPALGKVLFSDWHGVLPWTPIYAVGVAGLVPLLRRDRRLGAGLLAVLALQLYVNAANAVWWSGGSFGNRRLADCGIVVAYGVHALWSSSERRAVRGGLVAAVALCAGWSLWLVLAERRLIVPLDRYVPLFGGGTIGAMVAVFTEPGETWRALTRGMAGAVGGRIAAGVALGCAVFAMPGMLRVVRGWPAQRRAAAGIGAAVMLLAVTAVAALRTPVVGTASLPYARKSSGILFDNWTELAQYHVVRGEWPAAEEAAQRAIAMQVPIPAPFFYLGVSLAQEQRFLEAAAAFEKYLELSPNNERVREFRDEMRRAAMGAAAPRR